MSSSSNESTGSDVGSMGVFERSVAIGVSTGFCDCVVSAAGDTPSYRFENVFLAVGDVAESVSNRRLVALFPKMGEMFEVLRDSLGFFAGDGDDENAAPDCLLKLIGVDGRSASGLLLLLLSVDM